MLGILILYVSGAVVFCSYSSCPRMLYIWIFCIVSFGVDMLIYVNEFTVDILRFIFVCFCCFWMYRGLFWFRWNVSIFDGFFVVVIVKVVSYMLMIICSDMIDFVVVLAPVSVW